MHRFQSRYPGIALRLTIANTERAAANIHDGLADLGFVEGTIDDPVLSIMPAADDELALVVGNAHGWAGRKTVSADELLESRWVLRERGSGTRSVFEDALRGLGKDPAKLDVALELPSNESVRTAVIAGAGAAVLSSSVTEQATAAGRLVRVPFRLPDRQFLAIRHRQRHATRAQVEFLALVRS
jgi:DNA-binding transcriptional LysR family regulator